MAEFQEVLHQWRRLCDKHNLCNECPGAKTSDKESICMLMSYDNRRTEAEVEDIIMQWAAEHPEPVYPTWIDVLKLYGVTDETGYCYLDSAYKPIPADIAEKLEIEPKEAQHG